MSIIGTFNRVIGVVRVVEKNNNIYVHGVPSDAIERGIRVIWKTNRIAQHMFLNIGYSSFSFPSFFAAEVVYMLDQLTKDRTRSVNIRTLRQISEEIVKHTWLSRTQVEQVNKLDYKQLHNMTFTPLDFQMEFLKTYDQITQKFNLRGFILNAAPGSGKTFTSLALAECLKSDLIIVVCPPNAVERVWEKSIDVSSDGRVYKQKQSFWLAKSGKPYNKERILVVHYEALSKLLTVVDRLKGFKTTIILDESHNLNEVTSMRTDLFIQLCKELNCKDVVYASGTPVKALGNELRPILRVVDDLFTPDVEERYRKIYGKDATKALDILKHRFGLISFRVEKSQLKLADPIIEKVKVKSPNGPNFTLRAIGQVMEAFVIERTRYYAARARADKEIFDKCLKYYTDNKMYNAGKSEKLRYAEYLRDLATVIEAARQNRFRDIIDQMAACNVYETKFIIPNLPPVLAKEFKDVRSCVKYVSLKIKGECLGRILGRARIDCHMDMVNNLDFNSLVNSTDKKTLIFTSYVDVLDKTVEITKQMGFQPLAVYGKTNAELASIIQDFETNPVLDPLVATFKSLSTAVPMTMADVIIMLDAPFRAYIQDQAISRINRLGATTQTYVYMVELDTGDEPNISSRSLDILAWSQQQVNAIVGGDIPFDVSDINDKGEYSVSTEGIFIDDFMVETATKSNPMWSGW